MVFADEVTELPIYVHNGFLIKHILDDPEVDDGLVLIGTFIQSAFAGPSSSPAEDEEFRPRQPEIRFTYRFNDQTADERSGAVDWRRTEKHRTRDLGECHRHTFQIKAPLELEVEFNAFPFKVVSATLLIEMSTFTTPDGRTRLRPNILLHTKEKRNMCQIQKGYARKPKPIGRFSSTSIFAPAENNHKELFLQAKEKIDRSYVYDFASPFPTITYYYDTTKHYCPKYSVSFLLVEDGMKKFIEIVFPMILIAAMNHLNVINAVWSVQGRTDETVEAVDYINNSATLALAVVVFLPTMFGRSRFHEVFTANNWYITTIFVALVLSALPHSIAGSIWPARVGAYLFWGSFFFPIINGFRFLYFVQSQRKSLRPEFFMEDAVGRVHPPSRFKPKPDRDVLGEFIPIKDLVELSELRLAGMEYKLDEPRGKFQIVEYDNASEEVRFHSVN
ncbi:unnamed protein product [Cylindrotheca closterium]|uniref:Uncharacterized protein n=1 Tax=Cylindrotheca closterium TaxID=2856 RepID=A0AAD2CMT6_9STRA|nr:unnamed protein product [Cylindrotheca closterium]